MEGKDVFISYSSKDTKDANEICLYLEKNNITCFIAHRDIPKGVEWADVIPDAIRSSKCFLCIYSNNFNGSKHVTRELTIADNAKKSILSYRVDDSEYQKTTEYYLATINWINKNEDLSYEKLLISIQEKLKLPVRVNINKNNESLYKIIGCALVFIILFVAGFYHAYRHSTSNEQLRITALQCVQKSKNQKNLFYQFPDECFVFSRANGNIIRFSNIDVNHNLTTENVSTVESKLGYVSIGILLTKAFHVKVKGRQAAYYYLIVGTAIICGYGAGYYIHERYFPAQFSNKMKDFLSSKENWVYINNEFRTKELFLGN